MTSSTTTTTGLRTI